MAQAPFVRGQHGEILSPDEVKRLRERATGTLDRATQFRPIGSWTQGLAQLVDAWGGYRGMQRADRDDSAGREAARSSIAGSPVLSALMGGQPIGGASPAVMSTGVGQTVADTPWLVYSNMGATRNQPISADLVQAMSFLPELGVTMDVYSGGQPGIDEGGARVGSTRHDHGNAADVMFRDASGRMLDWNNPADIPVLQDVVRSARSAGVTGIGAGDDYMGPGRMHIGFGDPAVWGAGGSSANAPSWLSEAYYGAEPMAGTQNLGGQPGSSFAAPNQNVVAALMAARSDPWVQELYGPSIDALIGQQMNMQNAAYQQSLRQSDPMYALGLERAQLELDALRNPPPAAPNLAYHDGRVIDMNTGEMVQDYTTPPGFSLIPPDQAAAMGLPGDQAYQVEDATGKISAIGGGGVNVNVGGEAIFDPIWGNPDSGYVFLRNPDGSVVTEEVEGGIRPVQVPIGGGAADREMQAAAQEAADAAAQADIRAEQLGRASGVVLEDIGRVRDMIENDTFPVAGMSGSLLANVPGTPAHDAQNLLGTIRANIGFDRLQQMREGSPTGGALGAISDRELGTLQAVMGSIEQSQSPAQLLYNINRLETIYQDIMSKAAAYPNASDFGFDGDAVDATAPPPPPQRLQFDPTTGAFQ